MQTGRTCCILLHVLPDWLLGVSSLPPSSSTCASAVLLILILSNRSKQLVSAAVHCGQLDSGTVITRADRKWYVYTDTECVLQLKQVDLCKRKFEGQDVVL